MKFEVRDIILVFVVFLLLWGNLGKFFGWDNDGTRTKVDSNTKIEVRVDTVERIIEKIIVNQPIVTNMTKEVTVPYIPTIEQRNVVRSHETTDSIKIQLPINRYQDTLDVDGATLSYDHTIAGYLEGSKYRITFPKETITVTDSIFTTKTQIKNRIFDFFLVGGYQVKPYPEYEIGIDFVTKNWKVGVRSGYDPTLNPSGTPINKVQPMIKVEAGIRLFGY